MRMLLVLLVAVAAGAGAAHAGPVVTATLAEVRGSGGAQSFRDGVADKLERSYLAGLERCHLKERKVRASVVITRELAFTVERTGKIARVSSTFDKVARACVLKAIAAWKLGVPTDDAGAPVDARFAIVVELGPPLTPAMALEQAAASADLLTETERSPSSMGDTVGRRPADLTGQGTVLLPGAALGPGPGPGSDRVVGAARISTPGSPSSAPVARVTVVRPQALHSTDLTLSVVVRTVNASYLAGIKRCYKRALAAAPGLRGRVKLGFTVDEAGRTVRPTAVGFDGDMDRCILELMNDWRFPAPRHVGAPARAAFSLDLVFVPE